MDDPVDRIARRELGAAPDRVERVETGLTTRTYELDCQGEPYVVQVAAADDREDSFRRGLLLYGALAETTVPVPAVVTDGVRRMDGRRYAVLERLPGAVGERDVSPARTRDGGRVLARIHARWRFDDPGRVRFQAPEASPAVEPVSEECPRRAVPRSLRESATALREWGRTDVAEALERLAASTPESAFGADRSFVLCHGDFSPDNVLFDGDRVTGVLDFDRARVGHDWRDFVRSANAFWMHDPTADWQPRTRFYEGYSERRELGGDFERVEPVYRVETLAEAVTALERLGELSEREWRFYGERLLAAAERALDAAEVGSGD